VSDAIIKICLSLIIAILITSLWAAAGVKDWLLVFVFVSSALLGLYVLGSKSTVDCIDD
jgi:hypothetical protein